MTLKDILDETLKSISENELVFIRTPYHSFEDKKDEKTYEIRNYLLKWGGFQVGAYSIDESQVHLYSNGEILTLFDLHEVWHRQPVQYPIGPIDKKGRSYFVLFSKPIELAIGKDNIIKALGKYGLKNHQPFVEQQDANK